MARGAEQIYCNQKMLYVQRLAILFFWFPKSSFSVRCSRLSDLSGKSASVIPMNAFSEAKEALAAVADFKAIITVTQEAPCDMFCVIVDFPLNGIPCQTEVKAFSKFLFS